MYLHMQAGTSDCALFATVTKTCLLFDAVDPTTVILDQKVYSVYILIIKFLETNWIPGYSTISHTEHSMASGKNQ